jgi:hypothetical protein
LISARPETANAFCGISLAESRIDATAHWPKTSGRLVSSEVSTAVGKTGNNPPEAKLPTVLCITFGQPAA